MSNEFRFYYPIWSDLKSLSPEAAELVGISITAPSALHKRIVKAVKKEKWLDIGWKLTIDPQVSELSFIKKNSILTFYLTRKMWDGRMKSFTVDSF